jgi:ABC-type bacteriocin/lantibiotic exporter with double-glycine peptidase domain
VPKCLLPVPHHKQKQQADCLAACAAMILDYLAQPIVYADLVKLLQIGPIGTPSFRIQALNKLGLTVVYGKSSLQSMRHHLLQGHPGIAFVNTDELPYWQGEDTYHAVVVVGFEDRYLLLNDPYFDQSPQTVDEDEFLLAWSEHDFRYALIFSAANE